MALSPGSGVRRGGEAPLRRDQVVALHRLDGRPLERHVAAVQEQRALAELLHLVQRMRDEDDGHAALAQRVEALIALLPEEDVAHRERLVDQQHVGVEARRDGEGQADEHPARVRLDGLVDELPDVREGDDLVEAALDLAARHPQDGAVEEDVLAPRAVRVEAAAQLEERGDAAPEPHLARRRLEGARHDLEQRALARAVPADDADGLAPSHVEGHVAERPELVPVALAQRRTASA